MVASLPFSTEVRAKPQRMAFCLNSPFLVPFLFSEKYRRLFENAWAHYITVQEDNPWPLVIDLLLEDLPQLFIPVYQSIYLSSTPIIAFTLTFTIFVTLLSLARVFIGQRNWSRNCPTGSTGSMRSKAKIDYFCASDVNGGFLCTSGEHWRLHRP